MFNWKYRPITHTELALATSAGANYKKFFEDNTGLHGSLIASYISSAGLVAEAPQSFNPKGYHDLLEAHGPLWLASSTTTNNVPFGHVYVLYGVDGDGTLDGSYVYISDPAQGSSYRQSFTSFITDFERVARSENLPTIPQIAHFP